MSSELNPKIVKTSEELLTKIVKKPVITEKLLRRPPFRFIHDLIASIIKSHGFLKDLYKDNELIAENVKEKDTKIAFLQKAIDATGFIIGTELSAKPSKIVAGLETDKTNEWLQSMARAVIDKKDSSEAVQRVLNGEKPSKRNDRVVDSNSHKKKALNQNTKTLNNKNIKTKKESKESKETKSEENNRIKESLESIEAKEAKERTTSPVLSANKAKQSSAKQSKQDLATNDLNGNTSKPPSARSPISDKRDNNSNDEIVHKDRDHSSDRSNGLINNEEIVAQTQALGLQKTVRPRTAAKSALPSNPIQLQNSEISVRPPTRHERIPRPSSSRPAPPRVIPKLSEDNKAVEAELEEKMRLINAKPVENLITENNSNEETDQDFIVTDVLKAEDLESSERLEFDAIKDIQKGSLVKQLVETKRELEGNDKPTDAPNNDKKDRQLRQTNRDIEKLRQTIQALSQTANPLGKVLDYLQEDIDSMLSELKSWQEEYKRNVQTLEKSQTTTGAELEPYRAELNVLDSDIKELMDKISLTKANIIRNEEKLQKMVSMINRI